MRQLARACYRHRRLVLTGWAALVIGLTILASVAGGVFKIDFALPGSESQRAIDILEREGFASRAGEQAHIVFRAEQDIDDPTVREAMESFFADVVELVDGVDIISPYSPDGERQISDDRRIAYAELNFSDRESSDYQRDAETITERHDQIDVDGLTVELGGDIFAEDAFGNSELVGLLLAVVILLVAFGSVLAMGLPITTALFGIGCGVAIVRLVANVLDMPDFTTQAVLMISIGVGIDYALFIVTRYREGLRAGRSPESATTVAIDTAGRAVLFAGSTVVIALLGLLVLDLDVFRGVAIGTAIGVAVTMVASVTLLPALLGFAGRNIDRLGLPHRARAPGLDRRTFWYRWSRVIQRRPWPALLGTLVALLVLAIPVLSIRLGFGDAGNRPTSDKTRRAYDLLTDGFGQGFNGPLLLAAELANGEDDLAVLGRLRDTLEATPGVGLATDPIPNDDGDAAIMQVFPTTSPQDEATSRLVSRVRDDVVPSVVDETEVTVEVGGLPALVEDFSDYTARMLPVVMGIVLTLSFLLLMTVFRSILVPLKAVVMNLLSVGVAYGAMVAVFQWGWGASLFGVGREGPIEAWAPLMLFAVVFGLSMDYEVFLLSRIKEEYDRSADNATAVADGLTTTARVITAAALIMVCVFGAFVFGPDRALKLFGLGMAVAVFVDATIVRLVLVPATMELLGDRNWWIPRWLDRVLPRIHVEGRPEDFFDELERLVPEPERTP
ncbi:MAG TPA: MMPL family transporter, partial [Acidimicrobiales bacterium]